jgi:hypothetical protein
MRTVAPQTLDYLQKNLGTEPILVLGIEWVENGQEILYSDQKINGANYPHPTITQVSGFDTALMVSGSGDSQSISVVLDDIDGQLKTIFNSYDIHKRPVKVYHHFRGLSFDYKFLVFQGEINSPVVWNEGERTLSLTVLTHTEDAEVAFTMEEGDFPEIPEEALGKVWPLVFGQVCNMQAVQVRSPRKGSLISGEGWHDFTLHPRICQARYIQCPSVAVGEVGTITQGTDGGYNITNDWAYGPDPDCVDDRFETLCNLLNRLDQELSYEHSPINIKDGDTFPQNVPLTLNVDGAILRGSFSGTYFYVTDREHPSYADWEHDTCAPVQEHGYGITQSKVDNNWVETESGTAWYREVDPVETLDDCETTNVIWRQGPIGGSSESWQAYEDMESANFVWKPAGTEVFIEGEAEILYIVSLIPGTVDSVAAYKLMPTGRSLLMEVPSEYYTIYETDYDGYNVVEIGFDKKLSSFDDSWNDDIYVSFTSDEGPNPVDIIEWLLDKYTNLTFDTTSFNDVKTKMANYPCNFWVKERKNVLDLIHDIAYQTRCAIYIRNNVVYIKYLSEEPTSVRTITESDIIANSFQVFISETEDIYTKHIINWQKTEAPIESDADINLQIVLKHNVPKYGIAEQDWNYYTQNTYDTILKSATFWLIRASHTWKRVEFETPLKHLDLDIFDCVTLDIAQFSATPIKVVIESTTYNPDSNTIRFECWTPIVAGTNQEYTWAWPAYQTAALRFPLEEEEGWAGDGYDFNVTPPVDHILRSGYVDVGDARSVIYTSGDQNPSDLDDTAPTVSCEVSDILELEEDDPVFEALALARNTRDRVTEAQQSQNAPPPPGEKGGGSGDGKKREERTACGAPEYGSGCIYEVVVTYIWPDLVTTGKILGGCNGGPCGRTSCGIPCTGQMSQFCHTFGAAFSAWSFYQQKKAEIDNLKSSCGYCSRVTTYPYSVKAPDAIPDPDSPNGDCDSFPGDENAPNQGEMYEPRERP